MKELKYAPSGANEMKIKVAKRKRNFIFGMIAAICLMFVVTVVDAGINTINPYGAASAVTIATVLPVFMVEGKFKELTGAEWETFKKDASAEQLAEYFNAKNAAAKADLDAKIAAKADASLIEALKEEIKQGQIDQMKHLNDSMKQYGIQIKKLSEKEKEQVSSNSSMFDQIKKNLTENVEKLKKLKEGSMNEANAASVNFKAAGTMTLAGNVSGGNLPVEQRLAGLDVIATRKPRLFDIIMRGRAQSNVISWVSQANRDGAAGGTTEGSTKNQIDFDLVVDQESVKKRTAFIKVSTEMIDDVDFIASEIRNELMRLLVKDVESQVYSGDGTGSNLNGIRTLASAFAAGSFAGTVDNANLVDVLRVAMNQIEVADHDAPTYILLNPTDVTRLLLIKTTSTDKRYIDALQLVAGQLSLDGVPIIKTTLVTAGEYLVGNFDLATMYDKGDVMIDIGLDGNDFTKNLRTIIAEWRGALVIKTNQRSAFVKGVIATDAAALETP